MRRWGWSGADPGTAAHARRVAVIATALAARLGYRGGELTDIELGALLHDVGKSAIPAAILRKPGPLSTAEWAVMRQHPVISHRLLRAAGASEPVLEIARHSHERLDGLGYPDGLAGDEIPLAARIVLVADAFDALTSDRPYRLGRPAAEALREIRAHTGTQFCPRVVAVLEDLVAVDVERLSGDRVLAVA